LREEVGNCIGVRDEFLSRDLGVLTINLIMVSDTDEAIELYFMVPDEKFLNVGSAFDNGRGSLETEKAARYTCEYIRMTSMMGE
jgi:hypothetical protein